MKILHFGYFSKVPEGIRNQLLSEIRASQQLKTQGTQWDTNFFSLENPYEDDFIQKVKKNGVRAIDYFNLRIVAQRWLKTQIPKYDFILFRYPLGDLIGLFNIKIFNSVITVHHTFELEEIKNLLDPFTGFIKCQIERLTGYFALRRVKGIVGITPELIDYEIRRIPPRSDLFTWHYPNGIDIEQVSLADDQRDGPPTLLMVASQYTSWHGLDIVMDRLKQSSREFVLHIVGTLPEKDLEQIQSDSRFLNHGIMDRHQIREIAAECDLGLTSFALFRKGMTQACTLKTREYLAMGLPVYSGHEDPAFSTQFPYFIFDPNLDIENLFEMAFDFRTEKREAIRQAAAPFIDKLKIMETLISHLGTSKP